MIKKFSTKTIIISLIIMMIMAFMPMYTVKATIDVSASIGSYVQWQSNVKWLINTDTTTQYLTINNTEMNDEGIVAVRVNMVVTTGDNYVVATPSTDDWISVTDTSGKFEITEVSDPTQIGTYEGMEYYSVSFIAEGNELITGGNGGVESVTFAITLKCNTNVNIDDVDESKIILYGEGQYNLTTDLKYTTEDGGAVVRCGDEGSEGFSASANLYGANTSFEFVDIYATDVGFLEVDPTYSKNVEIEGNKIYFKIDGCQDDEEESLGAVLGSQIRDCLTEESKGYLTSATVIPYNWSGVGVSNFLKSEIYSGSTMTTTIGESDYTYYMYCCGDVNMGSVGFDINDVMYLRKAILKKFTDSEKAEGSEYPADFCLEVSDVNGSNTATDGTKGLGDIGDVYLIRRRILNHVWDWPETTSTES